MQILEKDQLQIQFVFTGDLEKIMELLQCGGKGVSTIVCQLNAVPGHNFLYVLRGSLSKTIHEDDAGKLVEALSTSTLAVYAVDQLSMDEVMCDLADIFGNRYHLCYNVED